MKLNAPAGHTLWNRLPEIMKEGPARQEWDRENFFNEEFISAMAEGALGGSLQRTAELMKNDPAFMDAKNMLDLGGGHALYSIAFTRMSPGLHATVMDLPHVVERVTNPTIARHHADRVTTLSGDFTTDSLGSDYDLIFASDVLYGGREQVTHMLRRIHAALGDSGTFVSKHLHIDDIGEDAAAVFFDLMFSLTEEEERIYSTDTFCDMLKASDFAVERVYRPGAADPSSRIIRARKIGTDDFTRISSQVG
ncbi:MAG: methyltransferase [Methanofollis sp.]|uniref:class I SAM-dependent methyltransferase n=1 Tax=Methanofollis sp. TaxID=2052835 RepID=UPI002639C4B3|nr:methyltransferase [Methanofollis sp.]MDD4254852.1 methyltransferase [Methanofollis sp.]